MAECGEFFEHKLIIRTVDEGPECPATVFIERGGKTLMDYLRRYQWLNGEHVTVEIDPTDIADGPLKTNRPVEEGDYMHSEALYAHGDGTYEPITPDGHLRLIVDGCEREVHMTFHCLGRVASQDSELVAA